MPKMNLKLVNKQEISSQVFLNTFSTKGEFEYVPGQFLSFKVEDKTFRSYSIVEVATKSSYFNSEELNLESGTKFISFVVNTKQAGPGSKLMQDSPINTEVEAIGPAGRFRQQDTNLNKIFVCTGTGLAPFVPMIKELFAKHDSTSITIYFGAKTNQDVFVDKLFTAEELLKIKLIVCLSSESGVKDTRSGFVNSAILEDVKNYTEPEFYLCGNPAMVESVKLLLEEKGADKIYLEKYTL
jgi:Na+-transporting NADH:ubiquinone oxidoreductase subunit F